MPERRAHAHAHGDRHGARQPERFDPARAAMLDDPRRFVYLPPGEVVELLDAVSGACVVDFGTGTGAYAIAIARLRPDLRIVAVDEQPEMLSLLRSRLQAEQLTTVEPAGIEEMPKLRGRTDRVLAINVLHEVGDAALKSLGELLVPAGKAIIIDWDAAIERDVGPPRDHVYTVDEARARLVAAGFRVITERRFAYQYALVVQR
jgi:ubiquinone/menaquinone biosynthesis C-methylase UbiE